MFYSAINKITFSFLQFCVGSGIIAIDSYTIYYFPPMFKMKQNIILKHLLLEIARAKQDG